MQTRMVEICLKGAGAGCGRSLSLSPRATSLKVKVKVKGDTTSSLLHCSLFAPSSLREPPRPTRLLFPSPSPSPASRLRPFVLSSPVPKGFTLGPKSMKWWEQSLKPNMREIQSTRDLVDSLRNAGDRLVVVDFFSPSCPGCKTLHPKICQLAEAHPDVLFLQVNYEIHKSMCYSLHVHVLPFFWFFRGAQGRLCGFSCTTQTIKKFKDALAKHTPDRCSLGPTKGLDDSTLLALSANKELDFTYAKKEGSETQVPVPTAVPSLVPVAPASTMPGMGKGDKELVSTER